jgi:hypothetical protein
MYTFLFMKHQQCYREYCLAYKRLISSQNPQHLSEYHEAHNNYVQQLHATNGMIKLYHGDILPRLLEELQECYLDTSHMIASSVQVSTDLLSIKVGHSLLQCHSHS